MQYLACEANAIKNFDVFTYSYSYFLYILGEVQAILHLHAEGIAVFCYMHTAISLFINYITKPRSYRVSAFYII